MAIRRVIIFILLFCLVLANGPSCPVLFAIHSECENSLENNILEEDVILSDLPGSGISFQDGVIQVDWNLNYTSPVLQTVKPPPKISV